MTQLKTKSGVTEFKAVVETVEGVTLHKADDKVVAKLNGVEIGEVRVTQVWAEGKEVKVAALVADIDVSSLIGKDPTTLTKEELIALTAHLTELANVAAPAEETKAPAKSKAKAKPAPAPVEEDEDEEEEAFELPEGLETYEAIAALGVKQMWAEIGKHIAAEAGIKARTPKDEMLEAIAEYFELEPAEDEEEEAPAPKAKAKSKSKPAPVVEEEDDEDDEEEDEDEDEYDDEDEDDVDSDEDEDEDDEDMDDEDEDEDDEDEFEDDEDEDDEEDDEDDVTEEDVDALFEEANKAVILAFCKQHDIVLPKQKLSTEKVKRLIKDQLFGDDE